MRENKNGTSTVVRLIEGVHLIWGPLNTAGFDCLSVVLTERERPSNGEHKVKYLKIKMNDKTFQTFVDYLS